eukprot:scaffold2977_cov383-Prasinococcus_capsulatus_cf.AAC.7
MDARGVAPAGPGRSPSRAAAITGGGRGASWLRARDPVPRVRLHTERTLQSASALALALHTLKRSQWRNLTTPKHPAGDPERLTSMSGEKP